MHTYRISGIIGELKISRFAHNPHITLLARFKFTDFSTVCEETHACSINGLIMVYS